MIFGLRDRDGMAHRISGPQECSDFEFVIEHPCRGVRGSIAAIRTHWPAGRRTGVPLTTMDEARP